MHRILASLRIANSFSISSTRMRFVGWRKILVDPDMKLPRTNPEPAAPAAQVFQFHGGREAGRRNRARPVRTPRGLQVIDFSDQHGRILRAAEGAPEGGPESALLFLGLRGSLCTCGRGLAGSRTLFSQGVLHSSGELGRFDMPGELPFWRNLDFADQQNCVSRRSGRRQRRSRRENERRHANSLIRD